MESGDSVYSFFSEVWGNEMEFLQRLLLGVWLVSAALLSISGEGLISMPVWLERLLFLILVVGSVLFVIANTWFRDEKQRPDLGDIDKG